MPHITSILEAMRISKKKRDRLLILLSNSWTVVCTYMLLSESRINLWYRCNICTELVSSFRIRIEEIKSPNDNQVLTKKNEVLPTTDQESSKPLCDKSMRSWCRYWIADKTSVGKSSRRCDLAEFSGTFWNISLVYKFVIHCIYSLVCNGIRLIPSQTNVRLRFCDNELLILLITSSEI